MDINHFTSLFENATEGIILTNGKGDIELVNPSAQKMFLYEGNELVGSPIEILIPLRYKDKHADLRKGFYKHPQNRVMGHGRDLHGRRKDGVDIPVEVSLSYYKRDEELFVIAFIVDITERKKSEENILQQQRELEKMADDMRELNADLENKVEERTMILKEALQELEKSQKELHEALSKEKELNEIKSRFVSMASHEFRTPLSTILSSASLISKYPKSEEQDKRDRHTNKIKDAVKHLNELLEDFLSLGRLDEGKVVTKPESFNVSQLLDDVVEEMKNSIPKQQHVVVEHSGEAQFCTDKKLFRNVVMNLLGNAMKFSKEAATVTIICDCREDELITKVIDQGIGISFEDQPHMFSSFYRGKNAVNIQGTGLGLHIVKRYVDLLDGSVNLESELDKGTTITVVLPLLSAFE